MNNTDRDFLDANTDNEDKNTALSNNVSCDICGRPHWESLITHRSAHSSLPTAIRTEVSDVLASIHIG